MTTFAPIDFPLPSHSLDDTVCTRLTSTTFSVEHNGSGECNSDLVRSKSPHDRNGRPFPYTRSKTRWRKRPSDELKYLREEIGVLESLLTTLSYSDSRKKLLNNDSADGGDKKELHMLQKISEESRERNLAAAYAENRRLKSMVASHFQVAKALQTALDENMRLRARKVCWPKSVAASDELVFALLDEEKELQYAAVDKVLDASGIARIYHPLFAKLEFQRDESGVYFQHKDVRVLPFSVGDVTSALRHSLTHKSNVGPSHHCRKFSTQDAFSQVVTVDMVEVPGSLPAQVTARHLLWFVVTPFRTVINWSSFNEYDGAKHIRLQKRLWHCLEPIALNSGPSGQGCVLRTVVRFTPVDPEASLKDIEEMADVIISCYNRDSYRVVMAVREQLAAMAAMRARATDM